MPRYSAGASRAGINTANSAYFQLRNTGTAQRLYVVEIGIGISVASTNAPALYVARSTAVGTLDGHSRRPAQRPGRDGSRRHLRQHLVRRPHLLH